MKYSSTWFKDSLERVIVTFIQAAIGVWILSGPADVFNVTVLEGAASAGLIAALSAVKAILAANVGTPGSASLNPDLAVVDTAKAPNYPPAA